MSASASGYDERNDSNDIYKSDNEFDDEEEDNDGYYCDDGDDGGGYNVDNDGYAIGSAAPKTNALPLINSSSFVVANRGDSGRRGYRSAVRANNEWSPAAGKLAQRKIGNRKQQRRASVVGTRPSKKQKVTKASGRKVEVINMRDYMDDTDGEEQNNAMNQSGCDDDDDEHEDSSSEDDYDENGPIRIKSDGRDAVSGIMVSQWDRVKQHCVIVFDFDDTLIDNGNKDALIPGSDKFLIAINRYIPHSYNMLWTKGGEGHIKKNLKNNIRKHFQKIIVGSHPTLRNEGKPITVVRRMCTSAKALSGPYIIVDDNDENLRNDQYDITIDVKKYYINSADQPLRIDYNAILTTIIKRINLWYREKPSAH